MISLPDHSRVWIYQADRPLSEDEQYNLQMNLDRFLEQWTAHGADLKAEGEIVHDRYIVIALDQTEAAASGCSIDSQVHFMQEAERNLGINFMNRHLISYRENGNVAQANLNDLSALISDGKIGMETVVFDNLVQDVKGYKNWEKSLKDSWMAKFI